MSTNPVARRRSHAPARAAHVLAGAACLALASLAGTASACGWAGENAEDDEILEVEVDAAGNPVAGQESVAGDVRHQTRMGDRYRTGDGVPRDLAEAARRYRIAAGRGYAPAQNNLGVMHEQGIGVPRSDALAAEWFRQAADGGDPAAMHSLGRMYLEGRGLERDGAKGASLIIEAARRGHVGAMTDAGDLYRDGHGVAADESEAQRWWKSAATRGDPKALRRLASGGTERAPAAGNGVVDEASLPASKRTSLHLYLTAKQAYAALAADPDGIRVVDVRTPSEFVFIGHVPGAYNVPLSFLDPALDADGKLRVLRPNEHFVTDVRRRFTPTDRIFLICRSGKRSARAANLLARAGFTQVYSIVDGFEGDRVDDPARPDHGRRTRNGWKNAGIPWTEKLEPEHMYLPGK